MNIGYIDSSFLLSIIFEDENYYQSIEKWNELDVMISSMLLEIETRINIYKYYIIVKKDKILYKEKEKFLNELIENINIKNIDNEILLEIKNTDILKRLKSLYSIHLATAHIFNKLLKDRLKIFSYDKNMLKVAIEMGMR
jgi:predicted nucleic acid-binding protein